MPQRDNHTSQIPNTHLHSEPRTFPGRPSRFLATRGNDASKRARSLVDHGVLGPGLVLQAHDFRLATRNGAHVEGVSACACACLLLLLRARVDDVGGVGVALGRDFEVVPVVAVLQAEDVGFACVVSEGCGVGEDRADFDQAVLDVEEAVRWDLVLVVVRASVMGKGGGGGKVGCELT